MKRFSEFFAERKIKMKEEHLEALKASLDQTSWVSGEEAARYLGEQKSNKTAVNAYRLAVGIGLNESPASERLVRGVARSVIRDHHEELERLAYK